MARKAKAGAQVKSGGKWGEGFRRRVRELIAASGSKAQFARDVNVHDRRVSDWAKVRLPNAANLYEISLKTGCSIDWLLGFEASMYRGRSRDDTSLADDLAAFIAQRVATATGVDARALQVSGSDVLESIAQLEIDAFEARLSRNKLMASLIMRQQGLMKPHERPALESREWAELRHQVEVTFEKAALMENHSFRGNVKLGVQRKG